MDYEVDCIYFTGLEKQICKHPKRRKELFKRKQKCGMSINHLIECDYQVKRGKECQRTKQQRFSKDR